MTWCKPALTLEPVLGPEHTAKTETWTGALKPHFNKSMCAHGQMIHVSQCVLCCFNLFVQLLLKLYV